MLSAAQALMAKGRALPRPHGHSGNGNGAVDRSIRQFEQLQLEPVDVRKSNYSYLVDTYYDLTTDFAEYGWGDSFHFSPRFRGDVRREALVRYEHHLAVRLELRPGQHVLDVGCGLGGPMRNIARLVEVEVTGITINAHQVERAEARTARADLADRCRAIHADFMAIPFDDAAFDAAFTIEATCHAPDRRGVFGEVFRVLRPGALFSGYEWVLTDRYDAANEEHVRLKRAIEAAHALPELMPARSVAEALEACGFEVLETEDMAARGSPETPWYTPLTRLERGIHGFRASPIGGLTSSLLVSMLERLHRLPGGSREVMALMVRGADALVRSGELGIFTPSHFFLARRP